MSNMIKKGIITILPLLTIFIIYRWVYRIISNMVSPISNILFAKSNFMFVMFTLILLFILFIVFSISLKSENIKKIFNKIEYGILYKLPLYSFMHNVIVNLIGGANMAFQSVVLVKLWDNGVLMTGFVTDVHKNGMITVFVPTGPNPTSGAIYHIDKKRVNYVDIPVEEALKSIVSCGAFSQKIVHQSKFNSTDLSDNKFLKRD